MSRGDEETVSRREYAPRSGALNVGPPFKAGIAGNKMDASRSDA